MNDADLYDVIFLDLRQACTTWLAVEKDLMSGTEVSMDDYARYVAATGALRDASLAAFDTLVNTDG